jgi:hypothetical protein
VAGLYLGDGVRGDPFAAHSSLGRLLLGRETGRGLVFEIFQHGADSLTVIAREGEREAARRSFSRRRGDLRATPSGVRISLGWRAYLGRNLGAGASRRAVLLTKASDGSLMVREDELAVGVLFLVPFTGTLRSWHRFSPPARSRPLPAVAPRLG